MKVVFMGTPDFAVPSLEMLIEKHEVVAVVTQPDKPKGRGKKMVYPIIKEKVFKIKGMTCQHCVANVTRAINAIEGVSSQVNLKKEEAHVVYDRDVDDQVIIAAVKQVGYDVI